MEPNFHYNVHNSPPPAPTLLPDQSMLCPHPISLRFILILSFHLPLGLQAVFPLKFSVKTLYALLLFSYVTQATPVSICLIRMPPHLTFYSLAVTLRSTRFNFQNFYMALALRWVFCTDIRTDRDFRFIHQWLFGFYNRVWKCLLRGRTDFLYKADYVSSLKG